MESIKGIINILNDYEKQANDFMEKTGATMKIEFFAHMPHFDDDKEKRDVYKVTISRNKIDYTFKFGQSIINSCPELRHLVKAYRYTKQEKLLLQQGYKRSKCSIDAVIKKRIAPNAYDILSCLQKYGVGSFSNFCSDFGYDEYSRKAEKTYFAAQKEFENVNRLFSDVMDELQEIQ